MPSKICRAIWGISMGLQCCWPKNMNCPTMFPLPSCTETNGTRNSKCQEVFLRWNVDNKFHFTKSSVFPPWCIRRKSYSSWVPSIFTLSWLNWCQQFPFFFKFWTGRRRNGSTRKQRKLAVGSKDCENYSPYQPIFFFISFKKHSFDIMFLF